MFATIFLLEAASGANLLFGFMPESLGVFVAGVALAAFAVALRRIFKRGDKEGNSHQK